MTTRVAIVTGIACATGMAAADALLNDGYTVVGTYHNSPAPSAFGSANHHRFHSEYMDVSSEKSIYSFFHDISSTYNQLDCLVNVASHYDPKLWNIDPLKIDLFDWKRILDVDLTGTFLCCRNAIPLMLKGGKGCIINFGASGSMRGDANTFAYNSAKVGLVGLTKSLARTYAPNIVANIIAPGSIDTGWTERWGLSDDEVKNIHVVREMAKRQAAPSEIGNLVQYLASPSSRYLNGQVIYFDGGISA